MKVIRAHTIIVGTDEEREDLSPLPKEGTFFIETNTGVFYQVAFGEWVRSSSPNEPLLYVDTTTVTITPPASILLMAYNIPADTLSGTGDSLEIVGMFSYAANANNKQVTIYLGPTIIYRTGEQPQGEGSLYFLARIVRISATTVRVAYSVTTSMALVSDSAGYAAVTATLSSPVLLACYGDEGGSGDVSQHLLSVELKKLVTAVA